jgi:hypothetical protein
VGPLDDEAAIELLRVHAGDERVTAPQRHSRGRSRALPRTHPGRPRDSEPR